MSGTSRACPTIAQQAARQRRAEEEELSRRVEEVLVGVAVWVARAP